jgi:hypothetical protein
MLLPSWTAEGTLPPGEHLAAWPECVTRFGWNPHRLRLLEGLLRALQNLRGAGCERVFLDGSFVTTKEVPGDYDGCWETRGVDPARLDPIFLDIADIRAGRPQQKAKYRGELFAASWPADAKRRYRQFFQYDRNDQPKGVVVIELNSGELP